jgi:pyridoxal phosphate enzyme (YggS family)
MTTLASRLAHIHQAIEAACMQAGRDPQSVRLLAVTKTFGHDVVLEAAQAGQREFGENYVQEALEKINVLAPYRVPLGLVWHCIGPLQSNKTREVASHFDWVHTLDRIKIAQRLNDQRPSDLPALQVCLQVNTDAGANKSGVAPEALWELAEQVRQLPRLRLRGLMAIPEPQTDARTAQAIHQRLTELFLMLNQKGHDLDTLSMGMSADLGPAIAAGSTMVRIGTALFGKR